MSASTPAPGPARSELSIVVCAFNGLEYTKLLVESIRTNSTYEHELIVYSDGSSDGTEEWLRSQSDIKWRHESENLGICTAMNRSAAMAGRRYLFFPNTDHVMSPGWDEALLRRLSPRRVVSLQCIEPGLVPVAPIFHAIDCGSRWDEFDTDKFHEAARSLSRNQETPGINYPFVISKDLWDEVGGLDVLFDPGPANDPDLFYRLHFAGAELVRAEDVIAYHFSGKSSRMAGEARRERREWQQLTDRNEQRFVQKWGEPYKYANGGLPGPGPEARRRWKAAASKSVPAEDRSLVRVTLDARSIGPRVEGIGLYAMNLVRALAKLKDPPQIQCLTSDSAYATKALGSLNISFAQCHPASGSAPIAHACRDSASHLFHGLAFSVPRGLGMPTVATIHDMAFSLHPEWYPSEFVNHLERTCAESIETASAIIANSDDTRRSLLARFPAAEGKVHRIYEALPEESRCGVDPETVKRVKHAFTGSRDFILSVGVRQRRKNAVGMVRAFAKLVEFSGLDLALVLVGGKDCEDPALGETIRTLGLEPRVVLTGQVPPDILSALYSSAALFAYPSLLEGFGFPPLEAMAHGLPVVCSDRGALPEVVGTAAKLVDPEDTEAWASGMKEVLLDEACRTSLREQGLVQIGQFSWDRAAQETRAVYLKCLENRPIVIPASTREIAPVRQKSGRGRRRTGLRVAIDARLAGSPGTGTGKYSAEIVPRLLAVAGEAEFVLIGPERLGEAVIGDASNVVEHVPAGPDTLLNAAWEQFSLPGHLLGCDLYFSPTGILPIARPCKGAAVIHGLSFLDRPSDFDPGLRSYLEKWIRGSALTAELLIAVSGFTKGTLATHYAVPDRRIRTIYHGRPADLATSEMPRNDREIARNPYILFVGSLEPNKGVPTLVEAFAQISDEWRGDLVLAARAGRDLPLVRELVSRHGLGHRVKILLSPPDHTLAELYRDATLFASSAVYESFGLPLVEAMSWGVPVVARALTATPEVVGEGGVLVEEEGPGPFGRAMAEILSNSHRRQELKERARKRADEFSWEKTARHTWDVLRECATSA